MSMKPIDTGNMYFPFDQIFWWPMKNSILSRQDHHSCELLHFSSMQSSPGKRFDFVGAGVIHVSR